MLFLNLQWRQYSIVRNPKFADEILIKVGDQSRHKAKMKKLINIYSSKFWTLRRHALTYIDVVPFRRKPPLMNAKQ